MTDDKIIARARNDYRETGRCAYANPFASGSTGFTAYERGWVQALKQDDKPSFSPEPPAVARPPLAPAPLKPSVNLYALAKGRSGPRK